VITTDLKLAMNILTLFSYTR